MAGTAAAMAGPEAVLLAVAGVLATVVFVRLPGVLLAAYLLIPVYKGFAQPYSPIDLTVLLAGLNMLQAVPLLSEGRLPRVSRVGVATWVALAGLVLFGVLYAPDQSLALARTANYWALVSLPLLPAAMRVASDPGSVRQFLWTFLGVGILTVGLGLARLTASQRLTVLNADTIDTARAALIVPILGVTFLWRDASRLLRGVVLVMVPSAFVVEVASGSRGPLLVLVVLGALGVARAILRPQRADWRVIGLAATGACAAVLVVSVVAPDLPSASTQRIGDLGQVLGSGWSGSSFVPQESRLVLYGFAVSLFEDQPVIGTGTASYDTLSARHLDPQVAAAYPHNAVLQFAAEYGLIGLAVFLGIVLLALVRRQESGGAWNAIKWLMAYFLLNAFVSGNVLDERTLWGLLLLLLVSTEPPRETEPTPTPEGVPLGQTAVSRRPTSLA